MKNQGLFDRRGTEHGERHAEVVFGFLDGEIGKAEEAARLVATCDRCLESLRTQADLVAAFAAGGEGQRREGCLEATRLAEMAPREAASDSHLQGCAACRLEWLLAMAEYPEESPAPAPKEGGVPWFERVLAFFLPLFRPQVLVPVVAAAGVAVIAIWLFSRAPQPPKESPFPYEAWSGDASILDQMIPQGTESSGGLAFADGVDPEIAAFRVGFAAGLVRDLYVQGRDSDALRTYQLVVGGARLTLDPKVAAEFVRQTKDPCALPGIKYPDICRLGILAYGVARTGLSRGWLEVDVPAGLRETVVRLYSKLPQAPPEAGGARAAPPGTPEAFGGILLDLFRF